ncbi:hypothetical protein HNY73_018783 [Argiope bruennichi]|uniref:Uncharacterized protein n=1 Tax=Argiope bruennichi TaxID=94029 RepID=A0A8T0EF60_ARGBR|nr:hypothetical protein HNY73_018783 [Argiope bruennichi]
MQKMYITTWFVTRPTRFAGVPMARKQASLKSRTSAAASSYYLTVGIRAHWSTCSAFPPLTGWVERPGGEEKGGPRTGFARREQKASVASNKTVKKFSEFSPSSKEIPKYIL